MVTSSNSNISGKVDDKTTDLDVGDGDQANRNGDTKFCHFLIQEETTATLRSKKETNKNIHKTQKGRMPVSEELYD